MRLPLRRARPQGRRARRGVGQARRDTKRRGDLTPAGRTHCGRTAVAHRALPDSRLEIFDDAGHFPQLEQPVRFARLLIDFIESTTPAQFEFSDQDLDVLRQRMLERARRSP